MLAGTSGVTDGLPSIVGSRGLSVIPCQKGPRRDLRVPPKTQSMSPIENVANRLTWSVYFLVVNFCRVRPRNCSSYSSHGVSQLTLAIRTYNQYKLNIHITSCSGDGNVSGEKSSVCAAQRKAAAANSASFETGSMPPDGVATAGEALFNERMPRAWWGGSGILVGAATRNFRNFGGDAL